MKDIVADLQAEQEDLDAVVVAINPDDWELATPATGWTIRDQIGHLTFFDDRAAIAINNQDAFAAELGTASADMDTYMASHLALARASTPHDLVDQWRAARIRILEALAPLDSTTRILWYGPPMSARSFATARIMETWAHGQDIVDALGTNRSPTPRLRHIAFLGVKTMGWSFAVNDLEVPDQPVRVDLVGPDDDRWIWNKDAIDDRIQGTAEEFCLVTTQRRHVSDTDLLVTGTVAERWMNIAQAFAGPPGTGRMPGQFR